MLILVIQAHPLATSFNNEISKYVVKGLTRGIITLITYLNKL